MHVPIQGQLIHFMSAQYWSHCGDLQSATLRSATVGPVLAWYMGAVSVSSHYQPAWTHYWADTTMFTWLYVFEQGFNTFILSLLEQNLEKVLVNSIHPATCALIPKWTLQGTTNTPRVPIYPRHSPQATKTADNTNQAYPLSVIVSDWFDE